VDALRFDVLTRALVDTAPRRAILGIGAASFLGVLGLDNADAKKTRKKCKKKCGPCEKCKKGTCKSKPDDTTCLGKGKCLRGRCNPLPICIGALNDCPPSGSTVECCSGHCTSTGMVVACSFSSPGGLCIDSDDCFGNPCVGYRCQAS
jgi:hypothetical protein